MHRAQPRASADLSTRLDRLEREARTWRRAAGVLGLVLAAFLGSLSLAAKAPAGSAPIADEVRTQRLVLVDADDNELGMLELDGGGNPHLLLRKQLADGTLRSGLLTLAGPGLLLREGRRGAFLGLDGRRASVMELTGDDLTQGARVAVQPDGSTGFYALGEGGQRRIGMEWLSTGHTQVAAYDGEGTLRMQAGVDPEGNANNALFDTNGIPRLGLVVPVEGAPALASEDAEGRTRAQLTQAFDGSPRLEFLNELGDVFWSKP